MPGKTVVRARIDPETKRQASSVLAAMGLSVSDAVRLLLVHVAEKGALPFDFEVPNAETIAAMEEVERGEFRSFNTVEELMADLNSED
jgi:DNA-damage-inducible protein J